MSKKLRIAVPETKLEYFYGKFYVSVLSSKMGGEKAKQQLDKPKGFLLDALGYLNKSEKVLNQLDPKLSKLHIKTVLQAVETLIKYPQLSKHLYYLPTIARLAAEQFLHLCRQAEGDVSSFHDGGHTPGNEPPPFDSDDGLISCSEALEAYENALAALQAAQTALAICEAENGQFPTSPMPFPPSESILSEFGQHFAPWPPSLPEPESPCANLERAVESAEHAVQQTYLTVQFICYGVNVGSY